MNEDYPQYGEQQQTLERIVTIGEWLKLFLVSLLSLIPFIGWIIMLVVYIVKATDTRLPQSYRNLIKAGFIFAAIWLALMILAVVLFATYGISKMDFSSIQNSIDSNPAAWSGV